MTRRVFLSTAAGSLAVAVPPAAPRTAMGVATTSYMTVRRPKDTLEFLEHCRALGAGGIQASLTSLDPAYLDSVRRSAEESGMFIEVMTGLPRQDAAQFERTIEAARRVGALCLRAACGGRRYEDFDTLEARRKFEADTRAAIARAVPLLEKHRIAMGVENHKDWTVDEQVALLKEFSSPYMGACLDTGNNIALLDDPMDVVEKLAPYAVSTHIKDMAVDEYPDGFLLSEVPLGEGMLDLKRILATIRAARPQTRMSLEMITRNPLQIPCLTHKYWITMPERSARYLARTLKMVRERRKQGGLPRLDGLDRAAQLRLEEDNVKQSLHYAREQLGL